MKKTIKLESSRTVHWGDIEDVVDHHHRSGAKRIDLTPQPGSEARCDLADVSKGTPLTYTVKAVYEIEIDA